MNVLPIILNIHVDSQLDVSWKVIGRESPGDGKWHIHNRLESWLAAVMVSRVR